MTGRILPDSTEKMVARALKDYVENPVDVRYDIFAKLVSEGKPKRDAYQRVFPDASRNTASCRASILMAHPVIREKVMRHRIGARDMAIALTPEALEQIPGALEPIEAELVDDQPDDGRLQHSPGAIDPLAEKRLGKCERGRS